MTRQQSQMMKGVAILLMIFLHLFNQEANADLCNNLVYINGLPLVFILSRAANPVAFFLILGGYGLYRVNQKGDRHRWSRILKLMIHYWVILLIFIVLGHFIRPDRYPGSLSAIISNISCYSTTYNGEMWFLLPYVVLSAFAQYLFRLMAKFRALTVIAVTFFIQLCTSFCISRYGSSFLFNNMWAYNPLLVLHLLFNFSLGAMAARTNFFEKLYKKCTDRRNECKVIACVGIMCLVTINCVFKYNYFYAFAIITCLLFIPMASPFKLILTKLGDNSMNMWMIHTWFCYYLFHNFIYSFSYPIVIFAILTILSYLSSIIVNSITMPIERLLMTKREASRKPLL